MLDETNISQNYFFFRWVETVKAHGGMSCYSKKVMAIPNVKRYRISSPDGTLTATLMAVLPKDVDVNAYLSDAAQRFDWKAYNELQQKQFKVRVGQQKQKKAK